MEERNCPMCSQRKKERSAKSTIQCRTDKKADSACKHHDDKRYNRPELLHRYVSIKFRSHSYSGYFLQISTTSARTSSPQAG